MLPALQPGDEVLVDPRAQIALGDIIVARHPYRSDVLIVKSLVGFDDEGRLKLQGLNPDESTDSRTQGAVPRRLVLGKVTHRFQTQI